MYVFDWTTLYLIYSTLYLYFVVIYLISIVCCEALRLKRALLVKLDLTVIFFHSNLVLDLKDARSKHPLLSWASMERCLHRESTARCNVSLIQRGTIGFFFFSQGAWDTNTMLIQHFIMADNAAADAKYEDECCG